MYGCLDRLADADSPWSERQRRYFDACVHVVSARLAGDGAAFPDYMEATASDNNIGRTYISAAVVAIVRHLGYFPLDVLYDLGSDLARRAFEWRVQRYAAKLATAKK